MERDLKYQRQKDILRGKIELKEEKKSRILESLERINKDKIEKNFQFLKSNAYTNRFIVLGPMLHSKDKRITSHVYTCIIALQINQILRNRLKKTEIELTTQETFEELEEITCYYTKILGKEETIRHINPLTETQKKILKAMQINIFD